MSLLNEYKSSLKLIEVEEILELCLYRPLAFLVVKLVYPTNITPNQITICSLIFGILGGISLGTGTRTYMLLGALFFLIACVLDCADGQLARLKNNGSQFGRILDGMADYLVSTSAYLGLGFGFANNTENPSLYWVLILAAAVSNAFHGILVDFYRTRFIDYTQDKGDVLGEELDEFREEYEALKKQKGRNFEKMVICAYIKYSTLQSSIIDSKNCKHQEPLQVSPEVYYKKNKLLIHLWTYLGPTTLWTFFVICILFNTLEVYLWGLIVVYNLYALTLYFLQKRNDTQLDIKSNCKAV